MRKIAALYHNEMIKTFRKVSVWVILGLMVVGVFGIGGLMKLSDSAQQTYETQAQDFWEEYARQDMQDTLSSNKANLTELQSELATTEDEAIRLDLQAQIREAEKEVALYEEALQRDILMYFNNNSPFEISALSEYIDYQYQVEDLKAAPADDMEAAKQLKKAEEYLALATKALDNKDYASYLELQNRQIKDDTTTSDEEKAMLVSLNELRLKIDPEGERPQSVENSLQQIETGKRSLLYNINCSSQTMVNAPLSAEDRVKLENSIAVQMYRLEKGLTSDFSSLSGMMDAMGTSVLFSFGIFLVAILMMILAGGSVSQEMSSGTIKSLIISPTKRWKIFVAKLLSLLTVGVLATLLLYVVSLASSALWFGVDSFLPYVTASGGQAMEINFFLYQLADAFVQFIDVFVLMLFAFMLSVITRNTAASVGISIGVYFGGSMAMGIVTQLFRGEWIKFIPFSNLSLSNKFFPYSGVNDILSEMTGVETVGSTSLAFSLCYLAVLCICLLYIAKDSFCRRDI